jgi:hypothetical protein
MTTEKLNSYFHEKVLQQVGEVCVDSGQLLIVDPVYLRSKGLSEEALGELREVLLDGRRHGPAIHTGHVGVNEDGDPIEEFPLAFLTSTGLGDGKYKVYVEKAGKEGLIKSVTVVFITELEGANLLEISDEPIDGSEERE